MIDSILYGLFGDSALDQFFDLLTPSCGWSEMNEQECVMSGCCWTNGKCSKSGIHGPLRSRNGRSEMDRTVPVGPRPIGFGAWIPVQSHLTQWQLQVTKSQLH